MAKKRKNKQEKRVEFSKIALIVSVLMAIGTTAFTFYVILKTGDTSALAYLIPAVFAETATATGFYYWKARAENKIKLMEKYGVDKAEVATSNEERSTF